MGRVRAGQAIAQEKLVLRTVPADAGALQTPASTTATSDVAIVVSAHKTGPFFGPGGLVEVCREAASDYACADKLRSTGASHGTAAAVYVSV